MITCLNTTNSSFVSTVLKGSILDLRGLVAHSVLPAAGIDQKRPYSELV